MARPARDDETTDRLALVLHRGAADLEVTLPPVRTGHAWHVIADSAAGAMTDDGVSSPDDAPLRKPAARDELRAPPLENRPHGAVEPVREARTGLAAGKPAITVAARSVLLLTERRLDPSARATADPALLDRLARAAGIAPVWWDVAGRRTLVSDDTKRTLLASMRLAAGSEGEARDTLRRLSEARDRRPLPHALISREGESASLSIGVECGPGRLPVWLTIEREDGEAQRIRLGADDGRVELFTGLDGLPARVWRVDMPALPEGRHRIRRDDAPDDVCHFTVAPRHCYLPDSIRRGARRFGVSAQLYALRRHDDQGIGDFTTLAMIAEASGRERAATIGINPLHMLFPGQRERASPYHPSDRRFLDPIYLDVADGRGDPVPEAARDITSEQVPHFGSAVMRDGVAYSEVWALKRAVLDRRFAAFTAAEQAGAPDAAEFRRFIDQGGADLWRFAAFQAIAESRPEKSWHQWPEKLRSPDSSAVADFGHTHDQRLRFHQYLQFLADRQLARAAARGAAAGLELGLFRDLAVGAAPDGAEAWARSEDLARGAWVGAPPDPFTSDGQNWHLPPPLPSRFAETGFASFASLVAANMRHAGILRIDHAMGLTRLFWVPDGGRGADGAYVAYPFADLVGQLALESARARCMVVGEDLGTVPDGFRASMTEADILSYRVLLLERESRDFRPASSFPARAVACVSTHDLPPLAGWWEGTDITERLALGLLRDRSRAEDERAAERSALVSTLVDAGLLVLPEGGEPPVEAVVAAAHAFIASTPADLMLVQCEDLAAMRVGVNLPGTDTERPNWRLRVPVPVEMLLSGISAQGILDRARATGRAISDRPDDTGRN